MEQRLQQRASQQPAGLTCAPGCRTEGMHCRYPTAGVRTWPTQHHSAPEHRAGYESAQLPRLCIAKGDVSHESTASASSAWQLGRSYASVCHQYGCLQCKKPRKAKNNLLFISEHFKKQSSQEENHDFWFYWLSHSFLARRTDSYSFSFLDQKHLYICTHTVDMAQKHIVC